MLLRNLDASYQSINDDVGRLTAVRHPLMHRAQ
jgi:hypothetical protein